MSFYLSFEIPDLPKTPNELYRKSYWIVKTEKDKWLQLIPIFARKAGFAPSIPLKRAKLTLTRFSSREPDYDNLVGSFKYVTDALVKVGCLSDDRMSVIGVPSFDWVKVKKNEGKIRVEVAES